MASVMNILNEISLGEFHFQIAVLLRETIFLSSMLLNAETWVNLSKVDIEELESVDKILLRRILEVPSSTPIPALYLELGLIPIRFKIQAKRIMYLHYILTMQSELLVKRGK